MKNLIPSYLLLLVMVGFTSAAQKAAPLHFTSISINNGLSHGFISGITQDKQGFIWFATGDGLNKYDGYSFTIYHHDPDDSTSIASDDLTYIFEDSKQRLWVSTRDNGLDFFDRETEIFYHLGHKKQGLNSDRIEKVSEDKSGALWIKTNQGIDRLQIIPLAQPLNQIKPAGFFNENRLLFTHLRPDKNIAEQMPNNSLFGDVFTDSRGHNFLATSGHIYEMNLLGSQYSFTKKFTALAQQPEYVPNLLEDTASYSLFFNGEAVIRFPGYDFNLPHTVWKFNQLLLPRHIITIDKNQMIWAVEGNNIIRINIPTGEISSFTPADSSQLAALHAATCIFSDRQGILWIGTGGYGVLKYDPEKERFHHILQGNKYYQIVETGPGEIITNNFNKIRISKEYPPDFKQDAFIKQLQTRFRDSNIIYFAKDTAGNLWIPKKDEIYNYNLKTNQQKTYELSFKRGIGASYPLFADHNNKFWFGLKSHFVSYDPFSGTNRQTRYPIDLYEYENEFLQTIYEDGNILWLGSTHGLFSFNVTNQQMGKAYFFHAQDIASLSNNFVYCCCNDIKNPGRYLWVGTKGGGLNRLDKFTGKFIRYNTKNGLANNVIYGILPGDDGNLWLSTNKGLSAFNPETQVFRNYDVDDGLQGNEFNRYSFCKTSNGLLVFGGMNGINYFDPNELKPLAQPDVTFTDFRLFNKPVNIKDPNSPLKQNISYAKEITLRYSQNIITFQFAAMDYRRTGNIVYCYKMTSFDKDWIYAGTAHEATFTNLDPGQYDFIVQASFEKNFWGDKSKAIHITILTPWYNTWWFYLLIATTTSAFIYALYKFRLLQLKRLERLRNRIARDLHDEVGSSISTIAIYSKIMQEQVNSVDFDNKPLVGKINNFAAEIMEAMNDIVWNINTKNDAFERIVSRMREHASQLLEAKGYSVYFDFDETLNRNKMNMDKRRDFYLIYKESVNNIAKYAACQKVWISLKMQNSLVVFTIKDDGKGFDKEKIKSSGNGLNNMQHRATALNGTLLINAAIGKGTEILLSFYAN